MKIGIYGNTELRSNDEVFLLIVNELLRKGQEVVLHDAVYTALNQTNPLPASIVQFSSHENLKGQADVLFSIGGDGTILSTIEYIRDSEIPVLGINAGRLGFLSSVQKEELISAIDQVISQAYELDQRTLLQLDTDQGIFGNYNFALNEFTLLKKDSSSMITIAASLDGEHLNTYWADGLIISTPTGSTAYSLSCGGPIILPGSGNLVITPIAPHNLNVRPVVIPESSELTLTLEGRSEQFLAALDSRSMIIDKSVQIKIKKADFTINLMRLEGYSFLVTLRNKLNWGLDKRN